MTDSILTSMDAIPTSRLVAINVRAAREQRGLTVLQLAQRSGIAKGTITAVESGRANPTIDTLSAIADALALPLTDLIAPAGDTVPVVRRSRPPQQPLDQQRVARWSSGASTELWHLRLRAGHGVQRPPHADGTVEIVLVHAGALRCGPAAELTTLNPGDAITFPADRDHGYWADGDQDADATVVMLMPSLRGHLLSEA